VALGAGVSSVLCPKDLPGASEPDITVYFIAVLVLLGVIIRLMPGQGLGLN